MENSRHSPADPSSSTATATATIVAAASPANGNSLSSSSTLICGSDGSKASENNIQSSLRSLNRASYKISKPLSRNPNLALNPNPNPAASSEGAAAADVGSGGGGTGPPLQPQPPVYNIDKSDFRDVVQKLTGSPAHSLSRPPPAQVRPPSMQSPPRPSSSASIAPPAAAPTSRLHRIRPPPLAHLSPTLVPIPPQPSLDPWTRPPLAQLSPTLVPIPPQPSLDPWTRPPLSPLPPLPTVSASAESPISAYMRRLRAGAVLSFSPSPSAGSMLPPPSSPLGFGCMLSPRTAYQMVMATPALQLPTSPGMHLASPRLGDP